MLSEGGAVQSAGKKNGSSMAVAIVMIALVMCVGLMGAHKYYDNDVGGVTEYPARMMREDQGMPFEMMEDQFFGGKGKWKGKWKGKGKGGKGGSSGKGKGKGKGKRGPRLTEDQTPFLTEDGPGAELMEDQPSESELLQDRIGRGRRGPRLTEDQTPFLMEDRGRSRAELTEDQEPLMEDQLMKSDFFSPEGNKRSQLIEDKGGRPRGRRPRSKGGQRLTKDARTKQTARLSEDGAGRSRGIGRPREDFTAGPSDGLKGEGCGLACLNGGNNNPWP